MLCTSLLQFSNKMYCLHVSRGSFRLPRQVSLSVSFSKVPIAIESQDQCHGLRRSMPHLQQSIGPTHMRTLSNGFIRPVRRLPSTQASDQLLLGTALSIATRHGYMSTCAAPNWYPFSTSPGSPWTILTIVNSELWLGTAESLTESLRVNKEINHGDGGA